nr:hypothetical protein [Tanacetum cinerariifolium]
MAPKRARTTRANPDPTRTTTATEPMTQEAINNLIAQRVAKALAEYETQRNIVVNGDTCNTNGTGPRTVRPTRECTYKDYLNCRPLKFNGTEGVIGLTRWFERTESVSSISNCIAENRYTLRFQELTLLYGRMFLEESDEIERPHPPMEASTEALIIEYDFAPIRSSPPPSPLSPLSSLLPYIPSPPLLLPSLPLLLPSTTHRTDIPEAKMPPQKRACFTALAPRFEEVEERATDLASTFRQETKETYVRHEDAQDERALLRAQINTLRRDRSMALEALIRAQKACITALEAQVG